jgi:hypothetical protein
MNAQRNSPFGLQAMQSPHEGIPDFAHAHKSTMAETMSTSRVQTLARREITLNLD